MGISDETKTPQGAELKSLSSVCLRESGSAGQFDTTHWSVVIVAGIDSSGPAREAMEKLCRTYWYPLYAFIRRRGYEAHEAQDLTQSFFARLLEKDYLRAVDRSKGKFRSFLLASLEHFLANEWRRTRALKRGGGVVFVPLDEAGAEEQYRQVPAAGLSPEECYEQQWATTLLDHVLGRLRQEFEAAGKAQLFQQIKVFLTRKKGEAPYAELAARLDTTEAALKMAISRMRQRYAELLRAEIAMTVSSPMEIEEELQALFAALSR